MIVRVKLKKDIVIKAGTIFESAPVETVRGRDHVSHIVGFGRDSFGEFAVCVDPHDDPKITKWFEVIE